MGFNWDFEIPFSDTLEYIDLPREHSNEALNKKAESLE